MYWALVHTRTHSFAGAVCVYEIFLPRGHILLYISSYLSLLCWFSFQYCLAGESWECHLPVNFFFPRLFSELQFMQLSAIVHCVSCLVPYALLRIHSVACTPSSFVVVHWQHSSMCSILSTLSFSLNIVHLHKFTINTTNETWICGAHFSVSQFVTHAVWFIVPRTSLIVPKLQTVSHTKCHVVHIYCVDVCTTQVLNLRVRRISVFFSGFGVGRLWIELNAFHSSHWISNPYKFIHLLELRVTERLCSVAHAKCVFSAFKF